MPRKRKAPKQVASLKHGEAKRTNIPTAEYESVMEKEDKRPVQVSYPRESRGLEDEKADRNRELDPQLVWRGKDGQDWSDLVVNAPPLYIQEKVKPKVLIDDLLHESKKSPSPLAGEGRGEGAGEQTDLFGDFNGLPEGADKTDFYHYEGNWQNRMILGDSLQVMASLAEREGLRGKVQCIYLDPPYGIKFNSNFQWSTTNTQVKDGKTDHITREPEQVKAFRDTWRDGIHSYLTYLRDRLTVARDLLTESGSIFVQIGDENVHRVRAVMDEVFGETNFVSLIQVQKTGGQSSDLLPSTVDFLVWYAKSRQRVKYRQLYSERAIGHVSSMRYDYIELMDGTERRLTRDELTTQTGIPEGTAFRYTSLISTGPSSTAQKFEFRGRAYKPKSDSHWKTTVAGLSQLAKGSRIEAASRTIRYKRYLDDFAVIPITDRWESMQIGTSLVYVVQTATSVAERCLLMATDPGDLVLDPTCGSGTTAYVAEQWGRRWITIDTSRVALALARARIMSARYPYYLLADSQEGQQKEADVTRSVPKTTPTYGHIAHGFVYQRVPHITLKSIANNTEIDVIWDKFEAELAPLREQLSEVVGDQWIVDSRKDKHYDVELPNVIQEWEVPRERPDHWPLTTNHLLEKFWKLRIERQREMDASIAAKADHEYLYDKPYEDKKKVRVAGPFTVESLSPHRVLGVDENDELIDSSAEGNDGYGEERDFAHMILENLRTAGVQQAHKDDRIAFTSLTPWPGQMICAEGRYLSSSSRLAGEANTSSPSPAGGRGQGEGGKEKRAGIFIGPEFGTVLRADLVSAAREAADAGFDVLIACAFSYDAHATELDKLGRIPVLKARMNADLHMADDLKNTGKGNLFVIFGEPDIDVLDADDDQIKVKVNGVDVFKPQTGEVISDGPDGIACWFVDTDYNEESFFVRQAYFLGASDPYKSLKTTLKAEINPEAWATLHSDTSRPFDKPKSGRIAVKIINHLGDEVMKVFKVS